MLCLWTWQWGDPWDTARVSTCPGKHLCCSVLVLFFFFFIFIFFLAGHAQPEAGGNAIKIKTYF